MEPAQAQPQEPSVTVTPLDTGVGVPPRPTASAPALFKDPIMGRPPFAAPNAAVPPSSQGNPPMPPSAPPRPPAPPAGARMTGRETPVASPERRTLVVGRGISVQGMVQDAERLVVEGTVEASMIHATELSVSPGGIFKGEVEVEDAEIAGTVDGTLVARGNLIVRSTGVVLGTARCRRLQVEDGGQITGRIEMLMDTQSRAPESSRPSLAASSSQNVSANANPNTSIGQGSSASPVLSYES